MISPVGEEGFRARKMGLVMARAGLGKTSILVQIALDNMLQDKNILHVSIGQSLDKTTVWYDDLFKDIARKNDLENLNEVQEEIMPRRMILTFNEDTFTVAKLKERLKDLIDQDLFRPACVLIDGCDDSPSQEELEELRGLMVKYDFDVWFSAVNHRNDQRHSESGIPAPYHDTDGFFETVILLEPVKGGDRLELNIIRDQGAVSDRKGSLHLDPSTLLITEN